MNKSKQKGWKVVWLGAFFSNFWQSSSITGMVQQQLCSHCVGCQICLLRAGCENCRGARTHPGRIRRQHSLMAVAVPQRLWLFKFLACNLGPAPVGPFPKERVGKWPGQDSPEGARGIFCWIVRFAHCWFWQCNHTLPGTCCQGACMVEMPSSFGSSRLWPSQKFSSSWKPAACSLKESHSCGKYKPMGLTLGTQPPAVLTLTGMPAK